MNLPSDLGQLLIYVNNLSGGSFSVFILFLFGFSLFVFFKQNRHILVASSYSLLATTIFAFLLTLLKLLDITFVWVLGLLAVVSIMVLYFKGE